MHPLSSRARWLTRISQLQPGTPAAPRRDRLPLLPLGPDGVHRLLPRRTQSSSLLNPGSPREHQPSEGEFDPASADFGYRAPLAPRLARPGRMLLQEGKKVKSPPCQWGSSMAERVGFEPTEDCSSRALQARALGRTMLPLPVRACEIIPQSAVNANKKILFNKSCRLVFSRERSFI